MRYQISEIRITPGEYADEEGRKKHIEKRILKRIRALPGFSAGKDAEHDTIGSIEILKESIDARKKPDVRAVYTVSFESELELPFEAAGERKVWSTEDLPGFCENRPRPVIAGFGPCGIFAALVLSIAGAKPIVLERGKPVAERMEDVERFWEKGILDPDSNVQFGEGGAGTFSDGKLTTGIRDERIRWVLEQLVEAGADPSILYRNRPHIGTDKLRMIVPSIRKRIESLGGEVRFSSKLERIEREGNVLKGIYVRSSEGRETYIETDSLILATGHSAEDTFRMLFEEGLAMKPKPFSIGVRVEHPQKDIDRAQYGDGDLARVFGPAEYKLNHRCENGRGVYTFCMCPGGRVINAASSEGYGVTNGMSDHARDGEYANCGLLVDVRVEDFYEEGDPLAGVAFQKKYEKLAWERGKKYQEGLPVTSYGNFREDVEDDVRKCLPGFAADGIIEAMPHLGRKLKGFDSDSVRMTAVETRSSSPVRIERDEGLQSTLKGVIPAGEGPGHAGGIMSAAVDGIRAAQAVLG